MKKQILLFSIMISCFLSSCTSTNIVSNKSVEKNLKGNWYINNIKFKNINENHVSATVFDQDLISCFENSLWKFIPNNNTGIYTLKENCDNSHTINPIKWHISNQNGNSYFLFKHVNKNEKAKHIKNGYQLLISAITKNEFTLEQNIPFEGKTITAIYNFKKKSD